MGECRREPADNPKGSGTQRAFGMRRPHAADAAHRVASHPREVPR